MRLCPKNKLYNFIFIDDLVDKMFDLIKTAKTKTDQIMKGDDITADNYLRKVYKLKGKKYLPWRFPIFQ